MATYQYDFLTGLSGALGTTAAAASAATGQAVYNLAVGIGTIISGNLGQTGSTLFSRDSSISGALSTRLGDTGTNAIAAGQTFASSIGSTISGNLGQTGTSLMSRDSDISGVLSVRLGQTGANAITVGQTFASSIGSTISGNLTATGATLWARDTSISGALSTRLGQTGMDVITVCNTFASSIGSVISGDLTTTGVTLWERDASISGALVAQISAASAGVASLNGLSGVITILGTGTVSVTAAAGTITISGAGEAVSYASASDLTTTGVTLYQRDADISGVLAARIEAVPAGVSSVAGRTGAVTLAQADIAGLTTADSPTFTGLALTGTTEATTTGTGSITTAGGIFAAKTIIGSGLMSWSSGSSEIKIAGPAGNDRLLTFGSIVAGLMKNRFAFYVTEAESSGNLGSRLCLGYYADDGSYISNVFDVVRDSGQLTFSEHPVYVRHNSLGTTVSDGLVIDNEANAANNAQQWSPRLRFRGTGWKTNATAATQSVDVTMEVQTIQGTEAATGKLVWRKSINSAAYADIMSLSTEGNLIAVGSVTTAAPTGGTAASWKLGSKVDATCTLDTAKYIQLDINGTLYKLALVTSS